MSSIATIPGSITYEVAFNVDPNQNSMTPLWSDVSTRVRYRWDTRRGRQYELDVNETGVWNLRLNNDDGALDPTNTTSAYAPNLKLYRGARARVNTAPTQNLLLRTVATGTSTMAAADTVTNWFYTGSGTLSQALHLSPATPSGNTTALKWSLPSGSTSAALLYAGTAPAGSAVDGPAEDCVQVTAGLSYSASAWLMRTASADATVQATMSIRWYRIDGTQISASSGAAVTLSTSAWSQVFVSGAAPAGAVWGRPFWAVTSPSPTTAANAIYATDYQFEHAAAPTSWTDPGTTSFLFHGGVERMPQEWTELEGTSGTSEWVVVDGFSALSVYTLLAPFVNEVLQLKPNFLYELNDPAGSSACADTAGKRIPAPIENSPYGTGSLALGSSVTSTTPTLGFVGTPGPVATFSNPNNTAQDPETFVSLHKTAAGGPPVNGSWTRIIHVRIPAGKFGGTAWSASASSLVNSPGVSFGTISRSGLVFQLSVTGAGGVMSLYQQPSGNVADGNWHQLAITVDGSGNVLYYIDGVQFAANNGTPAAVTLPFTAGMTDVLGCYADRVTSAYENGWDSDMALATELPFAATPAQMTNLYNSWRNASAGESTGARVNRVLNWIGWTGPRAIDAGSTSSMGPATDLTGSTALDALNNITLTEAGNVYMATNGAVTFKARSARYNARTPAYVFGEGPPVGAAGEWPCEIAAMEYDPSHLANTIQVTQWGGPLVQAKDNASAQSYYPRTYQRTVNTSSVAECVDAAKYLLSQLKDPHLRPETITLHPSAVPGLYAVCVALELGTRIRLIKRPTGAPAIVCDSFVESIEWNWDPDTGDVFVTLQASPADLVNYWVLAALHTTLSVQAAAGQNKATISALQDAAVNPLAASLPSGYSLTFEPGTARQETLAIAPGGIPATSAGWATAQITFSSNLQFTHAAGTVVCEPLPVGYTDPTTWDASSVIGAAYTTLANTYASGVQTLVVNALPDALTNALGSNWNTGDQIVLSPGTANAEVMTIKSVQTVYPGYTTASITFTANTANSHNAGDYVSDVLPNNGVSPTTLKPTARRAY